jgi:DNA processing protein
LYIRGGLEEQDRWAAAVVGTRRPTPYGVTVTREIAATLAANGITVVSGLARGIDAIAHRAALEAGGRTVAVLGSGLDHIYPPEHRTMAQEIARRGAVLGDYPLGTRPEAVNFPPRNRLISGLSLAVVVTEAGEGSGALITADFAAEQGREVFAVPGSIHSRASRGTNRLIRAGARPCLGAEDVLEALNLDVVARGELPEPGLPEDETERRILETLGSEPIHIDDLQARCGLPVAQITASLAMLELKGRARQVGGMHFVRTREPRGEYRVE